MNWYAIIGIGLSVCTTIFNGILFALIKFNDFKHLEISVKELRTTVEKHGEKVDALGQRISTMEGICTVCSQKKTRIRRK
jgi:hypothetical protein